MEDMFCYQCEQTAQATGCTKIDVCGNQPDVAALQDLIVWGLKGMAFCAHKARGEGAIARNIDIHMVESLFSTVTNVDFDPTNLAEVVKKTVVMRNRARAMYEKSAGGPHQGSIPETARDWPLADSVDGIRDMKLGPSLPAFITPNVLDYLVESFNIGPIGEVEADMAAMLG